MTVYSRSDRTSVGGVPGCDLTHDLDVDPDTGVRSLTCAVHEAWIKGGHKPQVLRFEMNEKTGQPTRLGRVPDIEPGWSSTPETVPPTPDEERTDKHFRDTAQMQIDMMNALGTAIVNGLKVPPEMMHVLRKGLPARTLEALQGSVLCPDQHDNQPGAKFCAECGISMDPRAALPAKAAGDDGGNTPIDLTLVHVQSLKKMCRERRLPDTGTKDELISRLEAA